MAWNINSCSTAQRFQDVIQFMEDNQLDIGLVSEVRMPIPHNGYRDFTSSKK